MDACNHELWQRDVAVSADGYCPICMASRIGELEKLLHRTLPFLDDDEDAIVLVDEIREQV